MTDQICEHCGWKLDDGTCPNCDTVAWPWISDEERWAAIDDQEEKETKKEEETSDC